MGEDHEVRDSDRSDTEGSISSDLIWTVIVSRHQATAAAGASLAPYSFEPSDSDSASASPDDDDDARDARSTVVYTRSMRSPRDVTI